MNFSKAKTFLIIMFLAVDIFLLYSLLVNSSSNPFFKNDSYEKVTKLLEERNIFIETDETILNQSKFFNLTLKNLSGDKDYFANLILGEFKVDEEGTYSSQKGKMTFESGEFCFIPSKGITLSKNVNDSALPKEIISILKNSGFSVEKLKYKETLKDKNGAFSVNYSHIFYEKELLNSPLGVYVKDNSIVKIKGGIYSIHSFDSENPNLKTKEEILIRFSNLKETDEKIYISSIKEGYFNPRQEYATFSVIPSIKITLKSGEIYYFDLIDGKLLENDWFYSVN